MQKLNLEDIKNIIPHRDPFLLIDKVTELDMENLTVTAEKYVTGEEYFFKGHFPGNPIMPGVLVLEAMAQAGACVILSMPEFKGRIALFARANDVKWKKMVLPKDTLTFKVKMTKIRGKVAVCNGEAFVGDTLACSAEITCAIGD